MTHTVFARRLALGHVRLLLVTIRLGPLSAQLRGDTSGAKRASSGAPVDKKPISVCTVCGKRGHNAADCWDKLDADQAKLDVP